MPSKHRNAPEKVKFGSRLNDRNIFVQSPKLFLVALENGQKVAAICIDDMPNDKLLKTIECQELMGRTWELELEEINGHP